MQPTNTKKSLMKKRIPTLAGLGILVIGLVVGVIFLGTGPGVFAPRATPETTPSKIKLTNVTDSGFTVSFFTPGATPGFIKYGTEANSIKSQTGDDRDQLSGTVGDYKLHHITVRGLKPDTTYYYTLGTGSNASFDNNGAPFTVKTAARGGAPSAAKTAYGNVLTESGSPANGAIVYASLPGVGEMSSLVKSSGSWAIPLSNARKQDGSGYATIEDTDTVTLLVQGTSPSLTSSTAISVAESQPVADITLGQDGAQASTSETETETTDTNLLEPDNLVADEAEVLADRTNLVQTPESSDSGENILTTTEIEPLDPSESLGGLVNDPVDTSSGATESAETAIDITAYVVDLDATEHQTVMTQTPVISGKAPPGVTIKIQVNSETQINQELIANEDGTFSLNIEELKKTLEPGEHEATYSYVDPATGQEVTKTIKFTVEADDTGVGGTTPYGSGNPYSIEDASKSAQATESATPTATDSSKVSTRSAVPATTSAVPVSGSVGTTMALVLGGIFFIMAGGWSYYLATQIEVKEI